MLKKVVVFDSGFGGELFADYLEEEIPIIEVVRVIDWRNSTKIISNLKSARLAAETALRPYIGSVDLIIFANFLLSTDLRYFCRKFKHQKFLGFPLRFNQVKPNTKTALILTTKALHNTLSHRIFVHKLKTKTHTVDCDTWPELIDDGELSDYMIYQKLESYKKFSPNLIILTCTQFIDIKPTLIKIFGPNVKIEDNFQFVLKSLCRTLKLRGLDGRKAK